MGRALLPGRGDAPVAVPRPRTRRAAAPPLERGGGKPNRDPLIISQPVISRRDSSHERRPGGSRHTMIHLGLHRTFEESSVESLCRHPSQRRAPSWWGEGGVRCVVEE